MAVNITYEDHAVIFPSRLIASERGAHIFNVTVNTDCDNGKIVSLGDHVKNDNFDEKQYSGAFAGKIVQDSQRPDFYFVFVEEPGDAILLYKEPVIEYEFNKTIKDFHRYYNAAGDVCKGYQLMKYDMWEVSKEGFVGDPEVGKSVSVDAATGKLKVA